MQDDRKLTRDGNPAAGVAFIDSYGSGIGGALRPLSKRLHELFKGCVGTTAFQSSIGSDE